MSDDIQMLCDDCMRLAASSNSLRSQDEVDEALESAARTIRSLILQRDAAYRCGQEDMRTRAVSLCEDLEATHEVILHTPSPIGGQGYVATYENTFENVAALPIKENPDDN